MNISVTIDGKTYQVEVEDIDTRPVIAVIDGEKLEVWPEEKSVDLDRIQPAVSAPVQQSAKTAHAPAVKTAAEGGASAVVAPIPGVVVAVHVKPGDKVVFGQELCALEAMKMKNAIRAGRNGVIKAVHASIGEHVHQSQLLVEFEEEDQS